MTTQAFRFGCQAYSPKSKGEWLDTAIQAEQQGYSTLHVADHYLGPGSAQKAAGHSVQTVAAIPAMMAAAAVTEKIKIGSRVMCVDYHHPLVLAMELATIDLLSDGRLEAGFGAGWISAEYESMGIEMDRPGIRIDRLIEVVRLAKDFFAGNELNHEGTYVTAKEMRAVPASLQENGPKIMIGGGSRRILKVAGQLADIVSLNFDNSAGVLGSHGINSGTEIGTMDKLTWVQEGAESRFKELEIEIGAYFTVVTDSSQKTLDSFSHSLGIDSETLDKHPHALIGSVEQIIEKIEERRTQYGISYITVGAKVMDDFAPVVDRLTGK